MTVTESQYVTDTSVRVAVRIRPQNTKEKYQMNQICTSVTPNEPQIFIGKDKAFTFDYVFNINAKQEEIFSNLTKSLIDGCLEGYNATILAYGQTGSGKTYTMGSGFDIAYGSEEIGIIPRAVEYLFKRIDQIRLQYEENGYPRPEFKVVAQFLELYNEELIDLLDTPDKTQKSHIKIHENTGGSIYLTGVSTRLVSSLEDTLKCLKDGTLCRSTASTNMNSQSSRSHAIFTLHIKQQRFVSGGNGDETQAIDSSTVSNSNEASDFEILTAKFHFVDLAGSERLKRTGATGDRAKEGISINCGLLALGNVISTLGDKSKRGQHVPYRNSKLTRLLQDSLGGNSQTIMIACISPSDCDFLETLNTLNYANRARNIKNKLSVNQDKTSKQLNAMRQQIESLQAELNEYKQGKRLGSTEEGVSDLYSENGMLQTENHSLRSRIKALSSTIDSLKARNAQILSEKESFMWKLKKSQSPIDEIGLIDLESDEIMKVVDKYTREVEDLRAKLAEAEAMVNVLQKCTNSTIANSNYDNMSRMSHISMTALKKSVTSSHSKKSQMTESESLACLTTGSDIDKDSLNGDDGDDGGGEGGGSNEEEQASTAGGLEDGDVEHSGQDNDDGDNEDEDEDEDDEDSDKEDQDAENYLHQSLATLSTEIDVKKRLIEELQSKQKQLQKIRSHYEHQLEVLQNRIKATENERDEVLATLGEAEVNNEERVKKVKTEYEKKLLQLTSELSQLQTAKREHTLMLRNQQRKDQELRQLQKELGDLKSMKVQLSKKLREEAKRTREIETSRNKEIVQLKKETRLKDNQIRNLEQDKQRRDVVLKRKQEEVEALRRRQQQQHNITNRYGNRSTPTSSISNIRSTTTSRSKLTTPKLVPAGSKKQTTQATTATTTRVPQQQQHVRRKSVLVRIAKNQLDNVESLLQRVVSRRHTLSGYETDLKTRVREREQLSKKLQRIDKKRRLLLSENKAVDQVEYEMRNIRAQIESVQEDIAEIQASILELEDRKCEENEEGELIDSICNTEDNGEVARYILDQLFQLAVNRGVSACDLESREASLKAELDTRTREKEQALDMLRIALQHSSVPFDVDGLFMMQNNSDEDDDDEDEEDNDNDGDGCNEMGDWMSPGFRSANNGSASTLGNVGVEYSEDNQSIGSNTPAKTNTPVPDSSSIVENKRQISKRKPASPEELLGVSRPSSSTRPGGFNLDHNNNSSIFFNKSSKIAVPAAQTPTETSKGLVGNITANDSQWKSSQKSVSNTNTNSNKTSNFNFTAPRSPNRKPLTWKHPGGSMTTSLIVSKNNASISEETSAVAPSTPPMSPVNFRRSGSQRTNEDNVFKRLTTTRPSPNPKKGIINPIQKQKSGSGSGGAPITCTHVAEGHTKAILDIHLHDSQMISGSKDRTAKVWDLTKFTEICSLQDHQTSVAKVRLLSTQTALTVCSYYIKMWDLRESERKRCVRTLWSSGLSEEGGGSVLPSNSSTSSDSNLSVMSTSTTSVCPPPGENYITDLALSHSGTVMFLATANSVKLWDMRGRYCAVGKLHGNHQAPVMVLAAVERDKNSSTVITGSKDHYVKVFEVSSGSAGLIHPSLEMESPHCDGVECLTVDGASETLFSGSRDGCIKKWDLQTGRCLTSLSQAHRDWLQSFCLINNQHQQQPPSYLVSACRSGVVKLWSADTCTYLGNIQAHDNCITSLRASTQHSNQFFSASTDGKVKLWRISNSS